MFVYPMKQTKNKEFKLYFGNPDVGSPYKFPFFEPTDNVRISKDGGAFASPSNATVFIGTDSDNKSSAFSLILTATEMNADVILVQIAGDGVSDMWAETIVIHTNTTGVSSAVNNFSPSVLTYIIKQIDSGFLIANIDLDNSGFNYYGMLKTNGIWSIIRESTDLASYGYMLENPGKQTYDDAWTNRTTLDYSQTQLI